LLLSPVKSGSGYPPSTLSSRARIRGLGRCAVRNSRHPAFRLPLPRSPRWGPHEPCAHWIHTVVRFPSRPVVLVPSTPKNQLRPESVLVQFELLVPQQA